MSALAAMESARGREFAFVAADHQAIAALVYAEVGILLPDGKAQLVYGRLAPRVRACRWAHCPKRCRARWAGWRTTRRASSTHCA